MQKLESVLLRFRTRLIWLLSACVTVGCGFGYKISAHGAEAPHSISTWIWLCATTATALFSYCFYVYKGVSWVFDTAIKEQFNSKWYDRADQYFEIGMATTLTAMLGLMIAVAMSAAVEVLPLTFIFFACSLIASALGLARLTQLARWCRTGEYEHRLACTKP